MAIFNEPTKWQTSLVNSGDANVIPQSTPVGTGKASFKDGFPQITQIPLSAGGQAPDRKDFNGLFKVLGDWIFFAQNGGIPAYSTDFDYVAGRVVLYNGNLYKCIQANGASSTVVAPDNIDPDYLGSDYWVQVATLADIANFANIDLSNLSATGQALFNNKADKDFSNVTAPTQAFKDMVVGWCMPDYTAGVSISNGFVCPDNGVVNCYINTNTNSVGVIINSISMANLDVFNSCHVATVTQFIARKGDVLKFAAFTSGTITGTFYPFK